MQSKSVALSEASLALRESGLCIRATKEKLLAEGSGGSVQKPTKKKNKGGTGFFEEPEELLMDQLKRSSKACAGMLLAERKHGFRIGGDFGVDIKLLSFEFVFSYMIRSVQLELVNNFLRKDGRKQSIAKQLIMGAGKSAVISPVLAIKLAKGLSVDEEYSRIKHPGYQPSFKEIEKEKEKTRLCIVIVPESLLASTLTVMRTSFSGLVQKPVLHFKFDRSSCDLKYARDLKTQLLRAQLNGAVVCSTPSILKTLLLVYIDTLRSIKEENQLVLQSKRDKELSAKMVEKKSSLRNRLADYEETADVLADCLRILQKSVALIDEVDQVMHALKSELNFPLGDKEVLNLGPKRWRLPIFLFNSILSFQKSGSTPATIPCEEKYRRELIEKINKGLSDAPTAFTNSPHLVLLRKDFYDSDILPSLCKLAALWIVNEQTVLSSTNDADEIREIEERVEAIAAYLFLPGKWAPKPKHALGSLGQNPQDLKNVVANLERYLPWDMKENGAVYGAMNLARQWVRTVLPHCISKRHRVEYGLIYSADIIRWKRLKGDKEKMRADEDPLDVYEYQAPVGRRFLAVPFTGKDVPSSAAEFSSPEVLVGMSILAYWYDGMREADVAKMIARLKEDLQKEGGEMSHRASYTKYEDWKAKGLKMQNEDENKGSGRSSQRSRSGAKKKSRGPEVLPLDSVQQADRKQVTAAAKRMAKVRGMCTEYLEVDVLPRTMKFCKKKMQVRIPSVRTLCCKGTASSNTSLLASPLPRSLDMTSARPYFSSGALASRARPRTFSRKSCWCRRWRYRLPPIPTRRSIRKLSRNKSAS